MPTHRPTFAKARRAFDNPVAPAKEHPAFLTPPNSNLLNLNLPVEMILPGAEAAIARTGELIFHTVGDTGGINGTDVQEFIAERMEEQIGRPQGNTQPDVSGTKPLFFYHLGDVVYYNGMTRHYPEQFYDPYKFYPQPIVAIAGNHDGDTRVRPNDEPDPETTLFGFMENFCASHAVQASPYRKTMTQPYVWWTLETPLLNIIGLYSNVDGLLDGIGTNEQQRWLEEQLRNTPASRPILVAVHHPPYSLDSAHGGYQPIGVALDRAMTVSGRYVDAVFSGHVHNYQRFTRTYNGREIPYIDAGAGGYAAKPTSIHKLQKNPATGAKPVAAPGSPFQTSLPDVQLAAYNDEIPGFLRIRVTSKELIGEYFTVDFDGNLVGTPDDTFTLDLKKHTVS